ncbi:BREX-1 system adenine-specific DNA-methyltransferase PglX [Agathobacter rectalis]|uniref:BREX-1 system adenine-specific DNA-methyltransferase PglX n=1 Tax=Agathobacter rectalis TaxID=39491 RepID=UPI0032BF679E
MNKNAIKKFAIDARNKLIASVTDKVGMLGITPDNCSEAITKGADFEVYKTAAGTEVTLNKKQCEQRRKLVDQIHARGFEAVVEEVAYTWFNRICAIRFMEVNDYMYPVRIRVLSSEKEGKNEPDVVTMAPDIDWNFTDKEREEIIDAKMNNRLDDLFRMLFIKQCNLLHEVLPRLFEETEDYTEMLLNISFTNEDDVIRMLVDGIDEKDFNITTVDEDDKAAGQVEIIGWLYQYYNTEPKNKAFAKKTKITKEEVPAVTQLFTPDWIVRYMVENSLGRMWVEGHPDEELKSKWKYYLDEAEQEESVQHELDKIKAEYVTLKPEDVKLIDPCMGSGHILVYAFDVFMQIYENAGWSQRDAAQSIIQNNIYGLDIDDRAAQLSYFAVLMKARQYDRRILTRGIEPNVYAVQESNGINRGQLKYFGAGLTDAEKNVAVSQMEGLLNTLNDAKEYGSLLNVEDYDWELLEKFVENTDTESQISFDTYGLDETAELLKRLIRTGKVMAQKYEVVATNPPYAGTSNLSAKVNNFVKKNYPDSKADLFAVFIERCGEMIKKNGYQAMITMHSWMFLSSFEKLRVKLQQQTIVNMAHLGARAFEEIGGEVVQTTSFVLSKKHADKYVGIYCRLVELNNQAEKENFFIRKEKIYRAKQNDFKKIPGSPVAYWVNEKVYHVFENGVRFKTIGDTRQGMATSDVNRFTRLWYEVDCCNIGWNYSKLDSTEDGVHTWYPYIKGGTFRKWYGNEDYLVNWKFNGKEVKEYAAKLYKSYSRTIKNISEYLKPCISWGMVTTNNLSVRYYPAGHIFDIAGCCCFSNDDVRLYLLGFLNSCIANTFCKILNPTINMNVGDIGNLPLIVSKTYKEKVDFGVERCIELAKLDWNSFETSWDFKCHPLISVISQNRTLFDDITDIDLAECYTCWENECNERFNQLKANEEELNRIFIDIYGLQDELTPEVEDKDVTVRKADLQHDIKSLVSYAVGCMFGRYSLDEEGLVLAGQPFEAHFFEASAPVCGTGFAGAPGASVPIGEFYYKTDEGVKKCTYNPDKDNIIPICDEEYFSDDIVSRFCEWVKIVYGEKSLETNLDFIAKALGNKGNTSREVIRNYFLNDFFKDHCNTYSVTGSGKRPIYWLFDSGKQNGFKALIYMHRYDADTVGRVRTDYLHRAQKYVETAMQSAQYTIDNAASASEKSKATKAVTKYTKQLAEMKIYDEAIAHVANQRIEIDLDDGVKVNYAKFQGVEVAQEGKKALKVDLLAKI